MGTIKKTHKELGNTSLKPGEHRAFLVAGQTQLSPATAISQRCSTVYPKHTPHAFLMPTGCDQINAISAAINLPPDSWQ